MRTRKLVGKLVGLLTALALVVVFLAVSPAHPVSAAGNDCGSQSDFPGSLFLHDTSGYGHLCFTGYGAYYFTQIYNKDYVNGGSYYGSLRLNTNSYEYIVHVNPGGVAALNTADTMVRVTLCETECFP